MVAVLHRFLNLWCGNVYSNCWDGIYGVRGSQFGDNLLFLGELQCNNHKYWLDVWCLQPQRWFRFVSIPSERVTDQTWATPKSIGLNHGRSSFSTSTLQNLGIPHFCRLFEHRAKPMSFPYEWGDAVNTSYKLMCINCGFDRFWSTASLILFGENSTGDHMCTFGLSKFWASQIPSWHGQLVYTVFSFHKGSHSNFSPSNVGKTSAFFYIISLFLVDGLPLLFPHCYQSTAICFPFSIWWWSQNDHHSQLVGGPSIRDDSEDLQKWWLCTPCFDT